MTVASAQTVEGGSLGFSIPLAAVRAEGDALPTRLSGAKRSAREHEDDVAALAEFSMDDSDVFDLSLVSPLCHQLLETKRRMLAQPPGDDKDGQSPRTDSSSHSDDETSERSASLQPSEAASPSSKLAADKRTASARPSQRHNPALEGLSPEAILQRKAQRRREQVRAASRRCRDRQRKETEDLRKKVFQLEEFIAHTIKSYEWELRQQHERVGELERENALLTQRVGAEPLSEQHEVFSAELELDAESLHSPSFEPVKMEDHDPSMSPLSKFPASVQSLSQHHHMESPGSEAGVDFWNEEGYPEMLLETVADTKRALISMLGSTCPIYTSTQIFGWDFDFWIDGQRYFAKDRKFFPGFRAYELAQRQHHVDIGRYMETFTEIKEKEALKIINEHVKIMRTVKALPGKPVNQSLTVQFASPVDGCNGSRWVVAERSIGELRSLKYGVEKECNGYVFEDVIKVLEDGTKVEGCLVQGVGGFECDGKQPEMLIGELMKAFSTVVLRWEGLFVNDYLQEDAGFADIELDFDLRPMC
jgi:hypothetical protein